MKIAVDFDGTCVDHQFPAVGPDVPGAVECLQNLDADGHQIFLYTMRSGEFLEMAVAWFRKHDIYLSGINSDPGQTGWTDSPKCYAEIYIDDAAFGAPLIEVDGFERKCLDWGKVWYRICGTQRQGTKTILSVEEANEKLSPGMVFVSSGA